MLAFARNIADARFADLLAAPSATMAIVVARVAGQPDRLACGADV